MMRSLRFSQEEIEDLKSLFVLFSMKHRGMDFENFRDMLTMVFGIYDYPFAAVGRNDPALVQLL